MIFAMAMAVSNLVKPRLGPLEKMRSIFANNSALWDRRRPLSIWWCRHRNDAKQQVQQALDVQFGSRRSKRLAHKLERGASSSNNNFIINDELIVIKSASFYRHRHNQRQRTSNRSNNHTKQQQLLWRSSSARSQVVVARATISISNNNKSSSNMQRPKFRRANCGLRRPSASQSTRSSLASAPKLEQSSKIWFLFTAILPLIVLLLALAGGGGGGGQVSCQQLSRQQEFVRDMSDLLTMAPPFAPTRQPAQLAAASASGPLMAPPRAPAANEVHRSNNVPANNGLPTNGAGKFVRTNELDAFLDDMNNSELRTVAAGRPIEDLFQARPVVGGGAGGGHALGMAANYSQQQQKQSAENRQHERLSVLPSGGSGPTGLMGSHSEQQIYSECALILQRTYVKNIDDPKHQLVPFGKTEQACISYKHIDKAIEQAKHKLKFREFAKMRKKPVLVAPDKPPLAPLDIIHTSLEPPEDLIAAIGEINMATTQIIADQFDLSNDELLNGLPLIDMSKTKFWDICPRLVRQDLKCELSRFRTFTAHCNNLKHPTWGAAMTPFARYLPPVHPDGIWIPRKSIVTEVTFELAEGHRETHSNIAPSMPMPVFDHGEGANLGMGHGAAMSAAGVAPVTHEGLPFDAAAAAGLMATHQEPPQRFGELPPPHMLPHAGAPHAADELAASYLASGDELHGEQDEPFEPASSVRFERRAPAPLHDNHARSANLEAALETLERDSQQHLLQSAAVHRQQSRPLNHYHTSHTPMNHFVASSQQAPVSAHSGQQSTATANSEHLLVASASSHKVPRSIAQELPSARLVTSIVHRDMDVPTHDLSILFMSWGQLLDHDMTRAAQPPASIKCCPQADGTPASRHKLCLPIEVPPNDPFYAQFNVRCLEFRRSLAGVRPNCVLGPRVHQNAITSPIDANFVYGSSRAMAEGLRLFRGGRLRDRDWFRRQGLKPLLPAQEQEPDADCIARPRDLFCFLAGDVRANEQTHLTVLHTLYMREHNRLADRLAELNPHWDDERIYQETRHIIAASVQHVMINEYIPLLIGRKMTELYNLTAQPADRHQSAYWRGYDPTVTTSVANSFAAAAFRQGHTFVQGSIERWNKFHEFVAAEKLRHLFKQPFLLYQPGVLDELTSGMINQASQQYDPFISEDISGHLFQPPELQFGHDLAAINLQRGREQGLPGYNLFREWCGLPRAETFEQLEPYLTNRTAYHYSRLYKHVDDIDLWSGGVSERKLPGAAIGPTFACIIARQFSNTRRGDRFWYENPGLPSSFTPDQLAEIRKITLAKILCANSDDLPTIQRWALRLAHPVLNPRVDCNQLPEMDLQFWQEE